MHFRIVKIYFKTIVPTQISVVQMTNSNSDKVNNKYVLYTPPIKIIGTYSIDL
jgi:hypothetical protein